MTKWERTIRILGAVVATAPFGFAAVRLLQTGSDVRPFWMAIGAFVGASGVIAVAQARAIAGINSVWLAFGVATCGAVSTAFLLGASAAPGIWAVGLGFGLFNAVYAWSRSATTPPSPVPSPPALSYRDGAALLAASELALILPAAFFLAAVVVRSIPGVANPAHQVVMWYANRLWTLWVLLIALPFAALISGCVSLLANVDTRDWRSSWSAAITGPRRVIAIETLAAGVILSVVVLHMLAN